MPIASFVKSNLYKDSVALMRVSQLLVQRTGIRRATLMMGTVSNKGMLARAELLEPAIKDALPSDIMVVLEGDSADAIASAVREAHALIEGGDARKGEGGVEEWAPSAIDAAVTSWSDANLAVISVPGPYAGGEALKALRHGLNVFLFSDNVPIEQERVLKDLALRKELLVMGPDCGTAIIGGVPLGFANVVRRGSIGLVGASGTGLQEVMCRIHEMGGGISHAIGTGSRDIQEKIGGKMLGRGLQLLAADAGTRVIVIVSKPPSKFVQLRMLSQARTIDKPVVVCFVGVDAMASQPGSAVYPVSTLLEAAEAAVGLWRGGRNWRTETASEPKMQGKGRSRPLGDRWIRGLFSGGTFCAEAQIVWRRQGIFAHSNAPLDDAYRLPDEKMSLGHAAIDLGSDEFTLGRPHPMIDYGPRVERILKEACDPGVAVILLDVVLGYGSHEDPAGALAPAISEAKVCAARNGRDLSVVCFVCGTEEDPQRLSVQQEKLRACGVLLASSSTRAAEIAAEIAHYGDTETWDTRRSTPSVM